MNVEEEKEYSNNWSRDMAKKKKTKAKKVRINLDDYHRRMGGIYDKKVIFYCKPKKAGKTEKALKMFEEHGCPEDSLFITIIDGNDKQTHGTVFNKDQDIVIDPSLSFIIIDDIHLLKTKKIVNILNKFRSSVMSGKLLCFGTNADENGKPFLGARLLEEVCDEVFYETDPCYFCGEYGKTSFTKTLFEKHIVHESDCGVSENEDEEDGYYYERDLCFDCKDRKMKKIFKNYSDLW